MKQEGLAYFTQIELTTFAMLLFLGVFLGMTIWVFRKANKSHFQQMSRMPLNDNTPREEL